MADQFDPYREALVVEVDTRWPEEYDNGRSPRCPEWAQYLHEHPEEASHLEYVRLPTGFCRRIVVTKNDIQRMEKSCSMQGLTVPRPKP